MLRIQAASSILLFLRPASKASSGCRIAWCLSRLTTTRINADECMAKSLRKQRSLHMALPAYHCTVIFHMASSGITTKVMTRSAEARLAMSGLRWEARRRPRPLVTLISTERLLIAAKMKSTRVATTRKRAATVNVGVSQSEANRGKEAFSREEFSQMLVGLADRRDTFTDILWKAKKKPCFVAWLRLFVILKCIIIVIFYDISVSCGY